MTRDTARAFHIALHRRDRPVRTAEGDLFDFDARQRLLDEFLTIDFNGPGLSEYELRQLRRDVRLAARRAGDAFAQLNRGRKTEARRLFYRITEVLALHLSYVRPDVAMERARVGPDAYVRRVRLPLKIVLEPRNYEATIAFALMERVVGAKSGGICPHCGDPWYFADRRTRKTCGKSECEERRKAAWRSENPEDKQQVNERVRRHRANAKRERKAGA